MHLQLTLAKHKGEMMGIMVMESGYGSAIPACVIAHMSKTGAAARSGLLNVGDHIISMNGVSLVGMPQKACIEQIKVSEWTHIRCYELWAHKHFLCVAVSYTSCRFLPKPLSYVHVVYWQRRNDANHELDKNLLREYEISPPEVPHQECG